MSRAASIPDARGDTTRIAPGEPLPTKTRGSLLPEIWALVISHLRRDMPPTASIRNPNDYHQADLARAMRVSKMFYDIAAPLLYERVIVSDLPRFFYGVPSLKARVDNDYETPKVKLFRYIKRLDLAYTSIHTKRRPSRQQQQQQHHLLKDARLDPVVVDVDIDAHSPMYGDAIPAEMLRVLNLPQEMVAPLMNDINMAHLVSDDPFLLWAMDLRAPPLFPNLKNITVGAFGERHWDTYDPSFNKLKFTAMSELATTNPEQKQALEDARNKLHQVFQNRFFGRYLANNCSPDHVCSHVSTGPFTYLHNNHFPNEPLLLCDRTPPARTYTTHLLEQINKGSWLHIVEGQGVVNRWIMDPVFWDVPADDQALVFSYFKGQFATRQTFGTVGVMNLDPQTKIEIYNLLDPRMVADLLPILATTSGTVTAELEKDREKLKATVLLYLGVSEDTPARVELMDEDPGVCPACGGGSDD
ncbi:hypothetical protein IAU59_005627 [Kwoniella sp. CBS 9459]